MDGDGDISVGEIEALLKTMKVRLQLSSRDIKEILHEFDKNEDGVVDMQEFESTLHGKANRDAIQKALVQRSGIRKTFKQFDKDGNGFITRDEFRKVVEAKYQARFSSNAVDKLMVNADKNGDGRIDFEEFAQSFSYIPVPSDFIVGYPGETNKDFQKTLDLIDIVKFAQSFSYIPVQK